MSPKAAAIGDVRTPDELLDEIEAAGEWVASALARLRSLGVVASGDGAAGTQVDLES